MDQREPGTRRERSEADTQDLARRGDREAFDRLYEKLAGPLRVWADLRIPASLRACIGAEDLVQEVWFRALGIFGRFDPATTGFRPWIFRVAKNVLLEATRQLRRPDVARRLRQGESSLFALDGIPADVTSISRAVARDEALKRVIAWVAALDKEERELVIHCGLEGMNHEAVAPLLGLGKEAVTKRWQRLRARLADSPLPRGLVEE